MIDIDDEGTLILTNKTKISETLKENFTGAEIEQNLLLSENIDEFIKDLKDKYENINYNCYIFTYRNNFIYIN